MRRPVTPDAEVEALAARAAAGGPLTADEAERLCAGDVLVLGGIADGIRASLHGDHVALVKVVALSWTGGDAPAAPPSEPPDEVRLEGALPEGSTLADVRATLDRARAAAPGAAVRAVRPAEVVALARAAGLPPRVAISRLEDAGLTTTALPSPADDAAATLEGLLAARGAGLPLDAAVLYGPRVSPADLARVLLGIRTASAAGSPFRSAVPVPDSLPEQSPLTGTTGLEDLRVLACARILLPGVPRVAVEASLLGPKLAAVALSFGADTLAGAACVPTGRLVAEDAEKPRPFNVDRARRLLAEAGRVPVAPPPFPERGA
jgi:2-iminoacetate synthase ThiH